MGKIFSIPFRTAGPLSDFACLDGEIAQASNVLINGESPDSAPQTSIKDIPPVPDVDLAIVRGILKGWHAMADDYPSKTLPASDPSMDYWTKMAAQLLSRFLNEAEMQHLFVSPFFALAAWKSVDGSYLSLSDPVFLIPNSDVPLVATAGNIDSEELEFRIAGALGSLCFRMRAPEYLRDRVGEIASLEILVSDPLHKYDSYSAFLPGKRVTTDSYCRSLDRASGEIVSQQICTQTLDLAWKANIKGANVSAGYTPVAAGRLFRPFASVPLREVDLASDWTELNSEKLGPVVYDPTAKGVALEKLLAADSSETSKSVGATVSGLGEDFSLVTRPLKLSGAGALDRVRRVCLRGNFDTADLTLTVDGSRDMCHWFVIGRRKGGPVVTLHGYPFRFYRIRAYGRLEASHTLEGLVLDS